MMSRTHKYFLSCLGKQPSHFHICCFRLCFSVILLNLGGCIITKNFPFYSFGYG
ncbi:hypothetical protein BU23DRAFT_125402 [Bimuria novae-zelandiae CBS 107.79]|uniref:Uncharacterized protein n=1 Tax=Bimuria novae-zelandiae CBS 107.79 TaxID=1447943 RepID=A0A6A5V8X1_9PLEO|nr:hypothetical protein BU23DRAFT_125402 [Bimuria novae-zelandiae CBS 107.79]